MPNGIITLIAHQKQKIEHLERKVKNLKKEKIFLSTSVFDHRYTLKQLKERLEKHTKRAA
jgi:hypothetical protein